MCTVSYIPLNQHEFVLTSNRDEKSPRNAHDLKEEIIGDIRFIFPVDPLSNGTWIGTSQSGRTCCLLNGGKENYVKKNWYRKSRGLVLKDFLTSLNLPEIIHSYDLNDIEPFTLVILERGGNCTIRELIWDGENRHISSPDISEPKLWSSVTLYDEYNRNCKKQLFDEFIRKENNPDEVLKFHLSAENILTSLNSTPSVNRATTISITQITGNSFETKIKHVDILNSCIQEDYLTVLRPFYA